MSENDRYGLERVYPLGRLVLRGVPVVRDAGGGIAPIPALRDFVGHLAELDRPPRAGADARAAQALVDVARADPALWARADAATLFALLYLALVEAVAPADDPTISPTGVVPLSPDMREALALDCLPPFHRSPVLPVALLGSGEYAEPGDWVAALDGDAGAAGVILALDRDSASREVLVGIDLAPRDLPPPPLHPEALEDSAWGHTLRQIWLRPADLRRATPAEVAALAPLGGDLDAILQRRALFAPLEPPRDEWNDDDGDNT